MRRLAPTAARRAVAASATTTTTTTTAPARSGILRRTPTHQPLPLPQQMPLLRPSVRALASAADGGGGGTKRTEAEPQVRPPSMPLAQRVLQLFGYGDSLKRTKHSEALLQACIAQAGNTTFYRAGRVSDAFRSAHGLLVLHVWMLHKRLLMEGEAGKVLEEALFDRLWEETTARIRHLKVNELSVNSYLKEVQAYAFGACVSYDAAWALPDPHERVDELAGALYRYVYLRDEHLTEPHVLALAQYVVAELESLERLPAAAVFESRFKWGALPAWPGATKGGKGGKRAVPRYVTSQGRELTETEALAGTDQGKRLEAEAAASESASGEEEEEEKEEGDGDGDGRGEWRTAFSEQGRVYWWNVRTRESTWEKPY